MDAKNQERRFFERQAAAPLGLHPDPFTRVLSGEVAALLNLTPLLMQPEDIDGYSAIQDDDGNDLFIIDDSPVDGDDLIA